MTHLDPKALEALSGRITKQRRRIRNRLTIPDARWPLINDDADELKAIDDLLVTVEAALAALPQAQPVPDGWVLVPRELTEAMLLARWPSYHPWGDNAPPPSERPAMWDEMAKKTTALWGAILAAAPKPNHLGGRLICDALGFDPTNHHNADKCPYCSPTPSEPPPPAIRVRVKVIDWQQSPPFITSISGNGSYEVNVKVHSMAELHAAHDLVLKAFSDAHSDLLAKKRWADANQG